MPQAASGGTSAGSAQELRGVIRRRVVIVFCALIAAAGLFVLDVVAFCTWRPRQESLLDEIDTYKPPIALRLNVASYAFVPVDLIRRFSDRFYRFTENWSDETHRKRCPDLRVPSPFLWRVATFYDDGAIESHEPYWGIRRHGWRYEWHRNRQKAFAAHDVRGRRVGATTRWCDNGRKCFECWFVDDAFDGYETEWDGDGTACLRGLWRRGKKVDGTFGEQVYQGEGGRAFEAVAHYRDGKFVRMENFDGTPVSDAYYLGESAPLTGRSYRLMEVSYSLANGMVTNALDRHGNSVPREQWQDEFR